MRTLSLFLSAAVIATTVSSRLEAIPAWARKYNMNCSSCHYPAVPRLNETGYRFRWAGYRMPDEIGEKVDVTELGNYVALGARARYEYVRPAGGPIEKNTFALTNASLFYAGPFGRNYGAFVEIEREAEDEIGLIAQVSALWGSQKSYGGIRAGKMHWGAGNGLAGFDRPVGINAPLPVEESVTSSVPFAFPENQLGAEAFYVVGPNRLSIAVFNGIDSSGATPAEDADTWKDYVATEQLLLDHDGSGVTALAYYGTVSDLDATVSGSAQTHFWRFGASANKIISNFEVLGGVVYGKDVDLPAGGIRGIPSASAKGMGYWFSGQYSFKQPSITFFGRYERLDPDLDRTDDATRRYVLGTVLPLNLPEYLRVSVEYWLNSPQAAGTSKVHNIAAELMVTF